jgi:hypothetical protein
LCITCYHRMVLLQVRQRVMASLLRWRLVRK